MINGRPKAIKLIIRKLYVAVEAALILRRFRDQPWMLDGHNISATIKSLTAQAVKLESEK